MARKDQNLKLTLTRKNKNTNLFFLKERHNSEAEEETRFVATLTDPLLRKTVFIKLKKSKHFLRYLMCQYMLP